MNKENLAEAIGLLDDDLITEASEIRRSGWTLLRRCGAMAACLLLLIGAIFLLRVPDAGSVFVSGEKVTSAKAITVNKTSRVSFHQAGEEEAIFSIPLQIRAAGDTTISVSGGMLCLPDEETGDIRWQGASLAIQSDIAILWYVNGAAEKDLRLTIQNESSTKVYSLERGNDGEWNIIQASKAKK